MLFRFVEFNYKNDDMYVKPKYLTGIQIEETYDRFLEMIKEMKDKRIVIRDEWYTIEDVVAHYNGGEDDLFSIDVYCCGM